MHRAIPAAALTAAGVAALVSFHSTSRGTQSFHVAAGAARSSGASASPSTSVVDHALYPPASSGSAAGAGPAPDSGAAGSSSGATATTAPSSGSGSRSVDGTLVPTRFGDVQVEAVMQGSKLVDISVLAYPNDRSRSIRINQYALPVLRSEALQAQSAQIDTVSGASTTSAAYRASLQAALDAARAKG